MSMSLAAHCSISSARAVPAGNPRSPTTPSDSPTIFTFPCFMRALSGLHGSSGRRAPLTTPGHVDTEVDGRLVRQLRREIPLLVTDDRDGGCLRLGGDERLARLRRELVALEVA